MFSGAQQARTSSYCSALLTEITTRMPSPYSYSWASCLKMAVLPSDELDDGKLTRHFLLPLATESQSRLFSACPHDQMFLCPIIQDQSSPIQSSAPSGIIHYKPKSAKMKEPLKSNLHSRSVKMGRKKKKTFPVSKNIRKVTSKNRICGFYCSYCQHWRKSNFQLIPVFLSLFQP